MATSWVSGNNYISQADMENNAQMFYARMTAHGFSLNAIAGMLGNIQTESGINPGIWEDLDPFEGGYGLVQWTPYTKYSEWAGSGWQDNGDKQCERINYEFSNDIQYYPTESYPLTAQQFKVSNDSPENLAETFVHNYERPASYASVPQRRSQARSWYNYLLQTVAYTPRLTMGDIYNSPYYTTWDAYYVSGVGMPNCTAYAFGRWNELTDTRQLHYNYPIHDGCDWYPDGIALGFQGGMIPALGAAACWWYYQRDENGNPVLDEHGNTIPTGHVAIVEQINYDSNGNPVSFITSNSAWYRDEHGGIGTPTDAFPYFYLNTISMSNLDHPWVSHPESYFQGFLYNPNIQPVPPTPTPTGRKMPFIFYLKRIL